MSRYRKLTTICAAVVLSLGLAACGGGGGGTSGGPPAGPDPALGAAQTAAATAAAEAGKAATAAETAADGQTMNKDADPANYALAQDSATRARAAANAAEAASNAAAATDVTATAQAQQAIAEAKQVEAEAEEDSAVKYAGMVQTAHQDDLDEEQRVKDVASARGKAMQSYMDADADATKAEGQADAAEATAPGTAGAMAARTAATAARTAATNAKAAHDAITDGMTKAQADAKASEAAGEASTASTQYMAAKKENDTIQTAHTIGEEQRRVQAIADARSFGGAAVTNAKKAADDAQDAADAAKDAADDANAAYMAAMNGRTDATEAKKHADAADAAHTKAQAAANDAMAAYNAAKAAIDGVTDDSTTDQANAARMEAVKQEGIAAGHKTTAMNEQETAEDSLADAQVSQGVHVLGLLKAANDVDETNTTIRATRINAVAGRIGAAAASTGNRNDSRDSGEATATVVWDENVKANPDTNTKAVTNYVKVTISGVGDPNIVSETQNVDANDDGDFTDDNDTKANAKTIAGLPGFTHGQDVTIAGGEGGSDRHVIVFTNKVQDTAAVTAKAAVTSKKLNNQEVSSSAPGQDDGFIQVTVGDLGTESGTGYTGVTLYEGSITISDTTDTRLALMGTLTCPGTATCNVEEDSDGKVTAISGYKFSGSRSASPAVTESNGVNSDYLVFGVWMDDASTPIVGAFANGATTFNPGAHTTSGDDNNWAALVGKATYTGSAAGLYTKGKSVDFFKGDATLEANFGEAPTTGQDSALGTITGTIGNIMAGGMATGDVISLNTDDTPGERQHHRCWRHFGQRPDGSIQGGRKCRDVSVQRHLERAVPRSRCQSQGDGRSHASARCRRHVRRDRDGRHGHHWYQRRRDHQLRGRVRRQPVTVVQSTGQGGLRAALFLGVVSFVGRTGNA